jgi:predicted nucleic acid-binding protein
MTLYVVDSSVVIKWFIPEALSTEAVRLQTAGVPLHAPDFIEVELAAIAWKKMRRDGMPRADADFIVGQLPTLAVTRHPTRPLVAPAFDLADRTDRTVYDCLYLALAVQLGGVVVTADDKLVNALASTPWAANVIKLQDLP